jgi:uncharacterized membrane protein
MSNPRLERLEVVLGRVLLAGVLSAAACLAVGLILWMAAGDSIVANRVLAAGLIVLMATPILRVVVSLVEYLRMRDWAFAVTTIVVLAVLIVTVVVAMMQSTST